MVDTTVALAWATSVTLSPDSLLTQTEPPPQARALGGSSSGTSPSEFPLAASIRRRRLSAPMATQTAPPATQTPVGALPTAMVRTTSFVAGEIQDSVPSKVLTTQTPPAPAASAPGPLPTR